MARWRFYQGLRTEWRWYRFDDAGEVVAESDRGFAELEGCMANAESAGFTGTAFQVHTRRGSACAAGSPAETNRGADLVGDPPTDRLAGQRRNEQPLQ
jgi:hypothetical protein